jgi:hypothetical protein
MELLAIDRGVNMETSKTVAENAAPGTEKCTTAHEVNALYEGHPVSRPELSVGLPQQKERSDNLGTHD